MPPCRSLGAGSHCWLQTKSDALRAVPVRRADARRQPVVRAAFWDRNDDREKEKERMFQLQQEILKERRSGGAKAVERANQRRQKIQQDVDAKRRKKEEQRRMLARGERLPDDDEEIYKDDPKGGIIIPLVPFGIPKFDNGERFDLKLPYVDKGWVDEDADALGWVKGLFGGNKKGKDKDSK
eukprot:evm.model.scf_2027.2 EVM.evm.TU.scf_2027.2   scf_2027:15116-18421(-)